MKTSTCVILQWRLAEGEHKDLWQRETISTGKQEVSNPVPLKATEI